MNFLKPSKRITGASLLLAAWLLGACGQDANTKTFTVKNNLNLNRSTETVSVSINQVSALVKQFGIENILLSEDCVDLYNPKVIRSTMGSIFHVTAIEDKKFYSTLTDLKQSNFKILTAHMKGLNVFDYKRKGKLVLSFCNEANGPTQKLQKLNDEFLNIPAKGKAESLNVASAAAIIISAISNS